MCQLTICFSFWLSLPRHPGLFRDHCHVLSPCGPPQNFSMAPALSFHRLFLFLSYKRNVPLVCGCLQVASSADLRAEDAEGAENMATQRFLPEWHRILGQVILTKCVIIITIIIKIIMVMFTVLSSRQSHCKSSPSSYDECRTAPDGCWP